MSILRPVLVLTALAALAGAPLVSASAQTNPPVSPTSPPASKPDLATPPAQKPAATPTDRSAANPSKANPLLGLAVFSSDGSKMGSVQSVQAGPDGKVTAIQLKTGGFLGIGGKMVSIPDSKFTKTGDRIQLSMTSDEVSKLPEVKNNS